MLPQRAQSTQRFIKSSVLSVVSVVKIHPSQQDATTESTASTEVYKILRALCGLCGNPPSQQDATTERTEYTEVYRILRALCGLCGEIFIPAFPFQGSAYHTIIKVGQTFAKNPHPPIFPSQAATRPELRQQRLGVCDQEAKMPKRLPASLIM